MRFGIDVAHRMVTWGLMASCIGSAAFAQNSNGQDWAESIAPASYAGCDESSCESFFDQCRANRARQRGTVGSLFRWSADPSASTLAQPDEPLVSDRPDFTEASSVVGLGILQLETGYTYTFDDNGTDRTAGHSYPETLLRYGVLANWLELRLAWNYGNEDASGVSTSGADDLYLGFKIGLTPQEGLRPEMALVPQMTVPTGGSSTTDGEVLPGLNWLYGWDINDFFSTAGSTQFNRSIDGGTDNAYTQWAQSWTIGYSLAERLGGYTEYYGFYPSGADTDRVEHYFNGGLTYSISNDIQWDIRGGKGLNDAADDYFVGSGLVIRFR